MKEQNEKQAIEEMAYSVCRLENKPENCASCMWKASCENYLSAENYYAAGFRKQSEGEWVETDYKTVEHGFVERRGKAWLCTNCRHASKEFNPNMKFCPNCGAKMKGDKE